MLKPHKIPANVHILDLTAEPRPLYDWHMRFTVTKHTAVKPPEEAVEMLSSQIPARRQDVAFSRIGGEIRARVDRDDAVWMTTDERVEIGRKAVLDILREVCERSPELKLDWFAISPAR